MGNSVYIVSVDAKDLFLANYSSPNSKEYSVKLAGSDHNDQFNTRRFVNTLDYSLDLIKLREVYEKVYRRMDFTFSKRGKEYCRRVINVTFKYSVKEFNRFFDNTYIKYGYLPQDVQLTDNICISCPLCARKATTRIRPMMWWTKCSKSSEMRWFAGSRYSSEVSEPLR